MTDITTLVDAATDKKTFNVLDTLAGRSYPEDTVTVHTNTADAYLVKLLEIQAADTTEPDEANALHEAIAEARDRVKASALTFHLKGFPPKIAKNIQLEARGLFKKDNDDTSEVDEGIVDWIDHKCLIESIQKVVDANGAEDTHRWTHEELETLQGLLPDEEYERLKMTMAGLSFATAYFEGVVDADF